MLKIEKTVFNIPKNRDSMNLQITFGIILVLFTATTILYVVNDWHITQDNFYQRIEKAINHNKNTVFVIGSSHVNVLNFTYINEYVTNQGKNYQIINLGKGADKLEKRVHEIDEVVSLKPSIVFYGIDYFDFNDLARTTSQVVNTQQDKSNTKLLPDPDSLFSELVSFENISWINTLNFKNPKLTTLTLAEKNIFIPLQNTLTKTREQIENETATKIEIAKQERIKQLEKHRSIATPEEIAKDSKRWGAGKQFFIEEDNPRALAFKEMMKELHNAGIKVVIFTTPRHQLWWDGLYENDKKAFFKIMDSVSNDYDVKIHFLHNKYSDLDIWNDSHHITMNPDGIIYTKDVANILVKEMEE